MGLGSEGRDFLQPLSLHCIFYKGAAAGAGFHSLLSVCLRLRRCWISVSENVMGPPGSSIRVRRGLLFAESLCLFFFSFVILCAANRKERKRVSSCFSLASMVRWPRRQGERSPGLLGDGIWMEFFFCSIVSVIMDSGPHWWLGCKVGSSRGCALSTLFVCRSIYT